ncbi:hypothetical protein MHYP_G00333030 [Metynnis hypsauchen]
MTSDICTESCLRCSDCYSIECAGELTVNKDIIPMGSNLTVRCQSNIVQCNRLFIIELDEQIILQEISCSNVTARLVVREPEFTLYCMVMQEGKRHLVCARNIVAKVVLSIPQIKEIAFAKGSLSPTIHWQSSDNMTLLKPRVRFRKTDGALTWMEGNVIQLHRGELLMPDDLEPLTFYEFELRVCTTSLIHNCSLWSQLVSQKSPGQAPSSKLDVWRVIMRNNGSDTQNITVLWKAFTPEDYKGDLLGYELVYKENGITHTLSCSVAASQYTLQLPLEVTEVNVSTVTSAGSSPPAPVRLTYTGKPAPAIYLSQAAGGRIHLNWNSSLLSYSNTPDQTLGFVVEWKCSSIEMQWKRIAKDQNSTFIEGTSPCTVYFSLYVESTEGVSDPAFGQIHVKDEKITTDSYFVKISSIESPPVLAAEGHEDVVLIGIGLMTAIPIIIILNLLYLKCARQRIRKTCMSVGPSWLFENLPKLGNSNAIKLLQDEKCEKWSDLCWQPVDSDPPLSPVEDFSPPVGIKDVYPIVHKDDTTEETKAAEDWASCPYKPQISIVSQRVEAVSEVAESEEDENPWLVFSPGFNKFDDEFLPSQEIHGPLKSCLTVDGTPISVDVVDGLIVLTQTTLEEEIWRAEGDGAFEAETGNCDENTHKSQTVLPSDLMKCLREPSFSVRPHSPQKASTLLHIQAALHTLQIWTDDLALGMVVQLEQVGSMPLKCSIWSNFIFLLVLATGAPVGSKGADEKICSIHSSKEVHMGSSVQIYCVIFKKDCKTLIFRDNVQLQCTDCNTTHVRMSIENVTQATTLACRCEGNPEPCGTDITPGYPPEIPQNLICVQEGELGNVNCTWKAGRETYIPTTSLLRVGGDPVDYESVTLPDGTLSASFPIPGTQTNFSVLVKASNSLGSTTSVVLSFMLNDIVKPLSPIIKKVECTSKQCQLYPDNAQSIQLVEIQYRADEGSWTTVSFNHTNSSTSWNITSLNPYSLYTFQVRWKLGPTRGVWSAWSIAEKLTDEEAPAAMVDAWYIEETTQKFKKNIHLFWKELSKSDARGNILGYNVSVVDQGKEISNAFITPPDRSYRVPCSVCNVYIFAVNSKGQSSTRLIQLQPIGNFSSVIHNRIDNHSIALSWLSEDTVKEYLVEWYPARYKQQLQWIRVERHLNTIHITDLQPTECYDGAVIYLRESGTNKAVFSNIATWPSAPQQGPNCDTMVKYDRVEVTWQEVPSEKRGGCLIRQYRIYLQEPGGKIKNYNVNHPQRQYTITGLARGQQYKLWISAVTTAEGPKGFECHFVTHQGVPSAEKSLALVVSIGGAIFLTCLLLLCICQFSSVHRRLSRCCHCLMPSIVPDPANSKWAKECANEKGEMKLQLYLSDSSMSEEEPDTVEVQELPQEKLLQGESVPVDGARQSVSNFKVEAQEVHVPSSPYQPITTSSYLKSLSNSSDTTQASRNTDITVDYISTHGVLSGEEDDEEEEMDVMGFFPCPTSPFLDPLMPTGGKLTLDIVKIDCSDLNLCLQ